METVLFLAVVKAGNASQLIKAAKAVGAPGGTVIRAEGTISSPLAHALGFHDSKREVVLIAVDKSLEARLHEELNDKLKLDRKGKGVLFSFDISSFQGSKQINCSFDASQVDPTTSQLMTVIVDRQMGDQVVEVSRQAGAQGATILHGRGTGVHETGKVFNFPIELEKEIVVMVLPSSLVQSVSDHIIAETELCKPGRGILFTVPVNSKRGLVPLKATDDAKP
ncbi:MULTISPECIES: P-II family nitrogen regulator [Aerococcus]|uniref:P-II family nitrogen regulator n=1 Tax=Aerococcus sanguinicola TaxID=119206 RepID=A0A5N1GTP6_9LACT|nr:MULTISPECIES: P-II family nitrogen regulator [Aerococcus]KAA9301980.1 P-II family nitrogen regulator [Aerococcus sanguinicola]MDK6368595.1 P-II family nitrogen regulator [Aerococcus sp. UMB9870]MDK6679678.1 P-II family nitrogen regulator [Aerococcus sp. UMB8608]MDK6686050.1 P-II family nitrogen regulator [Aerococcus sp. UMB8623]MDK6940856.1 P-II family nitrogen regulator [Aerococcus sp. UMB8487]